MPYSLAHGKVISAILCESVRTEIGNKFSIIGVIVGDLNMAVMPAAISLTCFMEYLPDASGRQTIFVRYVYNDKVAASIQAGLDIIVDNLPIAIPFPAVSLNIDAPGTLRFEASGDGEIWELLTKRQISLESIPANAVGA